MKPEILGLGAGSSAPVMALLDEEFTCHHLWQVAEPDRDQLLRQAAPGVRGVFTTGTVGITARQVAMLPALEIAVVHGIGVDAVDFAAPRARGIKVTNTPGVPTDDVADLAVALLLASAHRLPAMDQYVRSGAW